MVESRVLVFVLYLERVLAVLTLLSRLYSRLTINNLLMNEWNMDLH